MTSRYAVYICGQFLRHRILIQDYISLEATTITNDVGACVLRVPQRYRNLLVTDGILGADTGTLDCMPQFWIAIYECRGNQACLWEDEVYLIDKAFEVIENGGNCYIQLEAQASNTILTYRSIYEDEDNAQADRNGITDDVMHEIFTDQFGDLSNHDAAQAPGVRDWITQGNVADGLNGSCGAPNYDPRLEFSGDLLKIMQDAAKASAADDFELYFHLTPTIDANGLATIPLLFNTYCDHRNADRTVGNAAVNDPVILSPANGTIVGLTLGPDYENDYTVALGVGAGSGAGRPRSIQVDNRVDCTIWAWKEALFVDREAEEQAELDVETKTFLEDGRNASSAVFEYIDTPGITYGMPACGANFQNGDCITILSGTEEPCQSVDVRITAANIKCEAGRRDVRFRFEVVRDRT